MKSVSIEEALQIGLHHHQAGQLAQAESIYRQILAMQPANPDAMHLLGAIAQQVGQADAAVGLIERTIAIRPAAEFFNTLGNSFKDLNRSDDAIAAYRNAIAAKPELAEAHNNLGTMLAMTGRTDDAIASYRRAVELKPGYVDAFINLGVAFRVNKRHPEAINAFNQANKIQPDNSRAQTNLANALLENGEIDSAIAAANKAIAIQPELAEAHNNLAAALMRKREFDRAIASYSQAVKLKPDFADAQNNLGTALVQVRRFKEAITAYQGAIALKPDFADAWFNLGATYRQAWNLPEAIRAYNRAIALAPDNARNYENLGEALKEGGQPDHAIDAYLKAMQIDPKSPRANGNLGNAYKDQGRVDDALECYRKAMTFDPTSVSAHDNFIYTLWFHPDYDGPAILKEARQWAQIHADPLAVEIQPHRNDPSPDRKLRIGYVSSDFREHPVGRFLLPLLANHNPANVEVYCYAGVRSRDAITQRLQDMSHVWRDAVLWDDKELADHIRQDNIDILIDLTLHMCDSRLLAFARKPAPVQVTYLGYAGTTGMKAMDYRLGDPYLDPPGLAEEIYSEKTIRLPHCYWCYPKPEDSPEVNELPALGAGNVTFGCFNNFCKISAPTIRAWISLMQSLPNSRLMLHAHPGSHRQRFMRIFADAGIDSSRLEFSGVLPMREYLEQYRRVDIALDPFPYGGGTTTCDALWMGVPLVTLAGNTGVGRGGVTLLSNVGLPDWIAQNTGQYIAIANHWANNLPALAKVRSTLRQRMQQSPLMDGIAFAADVETAYRTMWHEWCLDGRSTK